MTEYTMECFIINKEKEIQKLSSLKKEELDRWKKSMEECALREYYRREIRLSWKKQ